MVCLMVSLPWKVLINLFVPFPFPSHFLGAWLQPSLIPLSWCLHQSHLSQISWFPISFHCFWDNSIIFLFSLLTTTPSHPFHLECLIIWHLFFHFTLHFPFISIYHSVKLNDNNLDSLPSGLFSNLNKLTSLPFSFINPPFFNYLLLSCT